MEIIISSLALSVSLHCAALAAPALRSEEAIESEIWKPVKRFGNPRYENKREPDWMDTYRQTNGRKRSGEEDQHRDFGEINVAADNSAWWPVKRIFARLPAPTNKRNPDWINMLLANTDIKRSAESGHHERRRKRSVNPIMEKPMEQTSVRQSVEVAEKFLPLQNILQFVCEKENDSGREGTMHTADDDEVKRVFGSARLAGRSSAQELKRIFLDKEYYGKRGLMDDVNQNDLNNIANDGKESVRQTRALSSFLEDQIYTTLLPSELRVSIVAWKGQFYKVQLVPLPTEDVCTYSKAGNIANYLPL